MSSPLQNRVLPTGEIVALPQRGLYMGNRGGRIHRADKTLGTSRWKTKQWIICVLKFRDWHREVMGDGYTELFFLDEVTALAAGHRPCFECQRKRAMAFAHAFPSPGRSRAPDMDKRLHLERRGPRETAPAQDLPDGAMVLIEDTPWAKKDERLLRWTPDGYDARTPMPAHPLTILTPAASRAALTAGYAPDWHPSAA